MNSEQGRERVLSVIAVAALLQGETPDDLAAMLGDPDWGVREEATRRLVDLCAAARPALERALLSENPEAAARAQWILEPWTPVDEGRLREKTARRREEYYDYYVWPTSRLPRESAAEPALEPLGTSDDLIARLSDADWQVRESAMRGLVGLGDSALPALSRAGASFDPEVRARATWASAEIREERGTWRCPVCGGREAVQIMQGAPSRKWLGRDWCVRGGHPVSGLHELKRPRVMDR